MSDKASKYIVFSLICLGNFTISFNLAAVSAVIPVIARDLSLSDFLVAKIITYYLIPYGIGALIYAPLTKNVSYKYLLNISMALYAVSCFLCYLAGILAILIVGRILMGVTAAGVIPLGLMVIGDVFEKQVRGRLVAVFFASSFISSFLGVLLSGASDWRMLFLIPGVLAAVLVLACFILDTHFLNKIHGEPVNYFKLLTNSYIRNISIFIFFLSFLYHAVHKWYGVYLSKVYHFDKIQISFYFMVTLVGGLLGQMLGGVISDKLTRKTAVFIGVFGISITIGLLAGHYSSLILSIILFLISIFWTVGHNGLSTAMTDFPDKDRPAISSLNSAIRFLSGGIGFYISGFFVKVSFELTFLIIGILILVLAFFINTAIPKYIKH